MEAGGVMMRWEDRMRSKCAPWLPRRGVIEVAAVGEVRMAPNLPTVTSSVPDDVTEYIGIIVPKSRIVQSMPSTEVQNVPSGPTTRSCAPVHDTEARE